MDTRKVVATITYHMSDNYGSVLQAFALQKLLESLGYSSYIIDYRKPEVQKMYSIFQPITSKFNAITNIYNLIFYNKLKKKKQRFQDFRNTMLKFSPTVYDNKNQLMCNPPKANYYICGSDQIWNTGIVDFDESYLLDFVRRGKKISYAASGIWDYTSEDSISRIREKISDFAAVSVRENLAKKRLSDGFEKEVIQVLDPVLMLSKDQWETLLPTERIIPYKYMLCYFAGGVSEKFSRYTIDLAKKMSLKRVVIMPEWRNLFRSGKMLYQYGPEEFVNLLWNASFVCTNSFHGTAFSVNFNKPFLVGRHGEAMDDRIMTLLHHCSLSDRYCTEFGVEQDEINFANTNSFLKAERGRCIKWLIQAIEE